MGPCYGVWTLSVRSTESLKDFEEESCDGVREIGEGEGGLSGAQVAQAGRYVDRSSRFLL